MIEIIAEAGSNHNGDVALAKALVDNAKESGADSVKFQFINPSGLYLPQYVTGDTDVENPVFARREKEVLADSEWKTVWLHAQQIGIPIAASVFDRKGIALLNDLGAPYIKIASTDLNNSALIIEAATTKKPVYLSTGMSTLSEIEFAVNIFQKYSPLTNLTLLHCVSIYPCPIEYSNLAILKVLKAMFGVRIGFSDHTPSNLASCLAVALGAEVIEKHFTLDKNLPGFDHANALSPAEIREFVDDVRMAYRAVSRRDVKVSPDEEITKVRARRGVYAARDLAQGEILKESDFLVVRPKTSLNPDAVPLLIGQKVSKNIKKYQPVLFDCAVTSDAPNWQAAAEYWSVEMREKNIS